MRWAWRGAWVLLCLGGCSPTLQERVSDYNEDGIYLFQRGDYAAARDSFQAAVALQPENADLLYNVAECYDRLGRAAQAERFYADCLHQAPNHPACRHALAALLVRGGRWAEASRMVHDWLAREPQLAAAYAEDGWLWHQAGDLPRAQARLQQALELDPHDPRALTELALVYESLQRPERAVVLYERILERDPHQLAVARRLNQLLAQGTGRPHPD
jgi:tetratricopeptide (TPR) repeat protein